MPKKKKKLPPYVVMKFGHWHIKREYPTNERWPDGRIKRKAITHKCVPETPDRAAEIVKEIDRQWNDREAIKAIEQTIADTVKSVVTTKKGSVTTHTYDSYNWYYKKYIEDTDFGYLPIKSVTPLLVQNFYKGPISGPMIRKLNNFLSMVFNQAVRWKVIEENPCKDVIVPRGRDSDIQIMNKAEARTFIKMCLADPDYLILALALETGCRPGEYLVLRWRDVGDNYLRIDRAVSFPPSGGFHYKTTKTEVKRTILISRQLRDALTAHKERQDAYKKSLKASAVKPLILERSVKGANYKLRQLKRQNAKDTLRAMTEHDLVFPSKAGTPMSAKNLSNRVMTAACKKAKVGHYSLYSLRHTAITLLMPTTDLKTIAERHGTSIEMIDRTYGHVLPSMKEDASDRMAEALY